MATVYNAPKSAYNKDEKFGVLNISDGAKVEFSEAVIRENDERLMVYAYVTAVEKVTDYGDKSLSSETWTPRLCKFALLKKVVTVKDKEVKPTPGMAVALHSISKMEGKPFSGSFDFQKNESDIAWYVLGQSSMTDITPIPDQMKTMIEAQNFNLVAIEELKELKDIEIPELGKYDGSRKGGYSSQTKKQQLDDSIDWLIAQLEPNSKLAQLVVKLNPAESSDPSIAVSSMVSAYLDKLFG